jgi:hypothetical protein
MERGRFSKEYAQFLCDRFYRRYRQTCSIKITCLMNHCDNFIPIRANTPESEQIELMKTFKCQSCTPKEYMHWSDEDEYEHRKNLRSSIMGDTE